MSMRSTRSVKKLNQPDQGWSVGGRYGPEYTQGLSGLQGLYSGSGPTIVGRKVGLRVLTLYYLTAASQSSIADHEPTEGKVVLC